MTNDPDGMEMPRWFFDASIRCLSPQRTGNRGMNDTLEESIGASVTGYAGEAKFQG